MNPRNWLKTSVLLGFVAVTGCRREEGSVAQPTGHITKCGIYLPAGSGKKVVEPGSATGYVTEGGRIFQSAGTNVALVKGNSFGFDFQIAGVPMDRPLHLTHIIRHPKMKMPDGKVLDRQSFDRDVVGSNGFITGRLWYTLREDYELLPGEWTLAVLSGTNVLVEKMFIVADPTFGTASKK